MHQEIETECGAVLADVTQIHQVLMNLCTNSYHAMRDQGGVLTVKLKQVAMGTKDIAKHPGMKKGTFALLIISDTGHGIPGDTQKRIFDPYFTTKGQGEGTGLGLATVHGIVKNHQGFINLESETEKGTTFLIYLPIAGKDATQSGQSAEEERTSLSKISGRVLFVDDEPAISQLGEKILRLIGCEVSAYTDSNDALEAFTSAPNKFDIVLTDQTMPGLTGYELSRRILEIRPDIPIILSTGFSENVNEQQAKEIGISEFIMKPLTIHAITEAIRKARPRGRK
ncbi:response regulator [Thermodesulfobacteriota bacterium]